MAHVLANVSAETAYMFTDWRMWTWTYDALEAAGYPVSRNMLVWDKEQMGTGFSGGLNMNWSHSPMRSAAMMGVRQSKGQTTLPKCEQSNQERFASDTKARRSYRGYFGESRTRNSATGLSRPGSLGLALR